VDPNQARPRQPCRSFIAQHLVHVVGGQVAEPPLAECRFEVQIDGPMKVVDGVDAANRRREMGQPVVEALADGHPLVDRSGTGFHRLACCGQLRSRLGSCASGDLDAAALAVRVVPGVDETNPSSGGFAEEQRSFALAASLRHCPSPRSASDYTACCSLSRWM
jgi:hypothetical protein